MLLLNSASSSEFMRQDERATCDVIVTAAATAASRGLVVAERPRDAPTLLRISTLF